MHLPPLSSVLAIIPGLDHFADEEILTKIHVREDDILLLSGSLVDGSGTPTSDFDFCVIAPTEDERFHRRSFPRADHMRFYTSGDRVKESFDYLPGSLIGVNAEYWTLAEIVEMLDAHDRLYTFMCGRARKSSSFAGSRVDFRMLSRLCYARPLQNATQFEQIQARIDRAQVCYTAFRTSVGSYPDFRDLAGMWAQDDIAAALLAARKLGTDTVRGVTHMFGNTNRNPKYLGRFVKRLPVRHEALRDNFLALQTRDVAEMGDEREAVLAWLDLIDVAYAVIRAERDAAPAFPSSADFVESMRAELHEELEWTEEIRNEYSFRAREALDGEPSLRDLLSAIVNRRAAPSLLPVVEWAAGREIPIGENNKSDD